MDYRITADERSEFKRCRRQWDFTSPHRRDLEPVGAVREPMPAAIKDALAMYYFPGMWDWSPDVVLPLVRKGFLRSIREANAEQGNTEQRYVEQVLPCSSTTSAGRRPSTSSRRSRSTTMSRGWFRTHATRSGAR